MGRRKRKLGGGKEKENKALGSQAFMVPRMFFKILPTQVLLMLKTFFFVIYIYFSSIHVSVI